MYFPHYTHIPADLWRWPHFAPKEIASKRDGSILISAQALDKLQDARDLAQRPFYITSAYRDELHNALIGGSPRSYHLEGRAFDISLRNFEKAELISILEQAGFTGLGISYRSFIHADTGRKRRW